MLALDGDLLSRHHCLFGRGTVIAMRYGEYRESRAIDRMENRDGWERCMNTMAMDIPKAVLWKHIRALKKIL